MEPDLRFDVPLFTPREAAQHLGVPRSTLRAWLLNETGPGPLVHRVESSQPAGATIPFIAMVEAHVLRALRKLGLNPREIRDAVTRLRSDLSTEYALASRRIATDGVTILVDMAPAFESSPRWERARDGQLAIPKVFEEYLKFVSWSGRDDYADRLKLPRYQGADVIIDPRFSFGQPILQRSKIRVEDIVDAFRAGESSQVIAGEFGVELTEVEAVIRTQLKAA